MTLYWATAFLVLLLLHFAFLPRFIARFVSSPLGPPDGSGAYTSRPFLAWSSVVALFTAAAYAVSVAVWGYAGYLGTRFFLCAPVVWFFRWLGGGMRDLEESEGFDQEVAETLMGCVVGTAVAWGLARLLVGGG